MKEVKSREDKHELKTVFIDEICMAIKFRLHPNYENKLKNPDNQVRHEVIKPSILYNSYMYRVRYRYGRKFFICVLRMSRAIEKIL